MRRALIRRPSPRLAEGLLTHIERVAVEVDLAFRQWEEYVAALQAEGWETIEVPPAPECPDSVFVEDTVVMCGDVAVVTRPGADERRPETAGTEQTLHELGYRIRHIDLKSAVTALPDGTVVGFEELVDDPTVWPRFLAVPEEPGAHVVLLGDDTVLMSASAPLTGQLYEARGLRVVAVGMTEYEKLEGCVTCLSVRLRD